MFFQMLQAQIYSLALTTCIGSPGQATQVESWLSYLYNFLRGVGEILPPVSGKNPTTEYLFKSISFV